MPKASMGKGRVGIYLIKGVTDALVLTIRELRKLICLSRTKQRERLMGVLYASVTDNRRTASVVKHGITDTHTWGFRRCSFRQTGQCEGLRIVERVTTRLHAFYFVYQRL